MIQLRKASLQIFRRRNFKSSFGLFRAILGATSILLFEQSLAQSASSSHGPTNERKNDPGVSNDARIAKAHLDMSLTSIARFGDNYFIRLKTSSGHTLEFAVWNRGSVSNSSTYSGLKVVDVDSRSVRIALPKPEACINATTLDVDCNDVVFEITFAVEQSVAKAPTARINESYVSDSGIFDIPDVTEEELRKGLATFAREQADYRYQGIVIADDEIPDGYARVRTPSGDFLANLELFDGSHF